MLLSPLLTRCDAARARGGLAVHLHLAQLLDLSPAVGLERHCQGRRKEGVRQRMASGLE